MSVNLKKEIIKAVVKFNATGLSMGTSGNLSARTDDGFLITPTGIAYDDMQDKDIVLLDIAGSTNETKNEASSEWRIHSDIYAQRSKSHPMPLPLPVLARRSLPFIMRSRLPEAIQYAAVNMPRMELRICQIMP